MLDLIKYKASLSNSSEANAKKQAILEVVNFSTIRRLESKLISNLSLVGSKMYGEVLSGELLSSLNILLADLISNSDFKVNPSTVLTTTSLHIGKVIDFKLLKSIAHFLATNYVDIRQNRPLSVPLLDDNSEPGWTYSKFMSCSDSLVNGVPTINYKLEIMSTPWVGSILDKSVPLFHPAYSVLLYKAGITNRKIKSAMPNSLLGLYICTNVKRSFNSDLLTYFEYRFDSCADNQNKGLISARRKKS